MEVKSLLSLVLMIVRRYDFFSFHFALDMLILMPSVASEAEKTYINNNNIYTGLLEIDCFMSHFKSGHHFLTFEKNSGKC